MIYKFYRPTSVFSQGDGSNPSYPTSLDSLGSRQASKLMDRFVSWSASPSDPVRFELENGSIDAQESVGGGVLLVVTGHLYMGEARKAFCHTFFLNAFSSTDTRKRQFYIHNDILRFLQEDLPPLRETLLAAVAEEEEEDDGVLDNGTSLSSSWETEQRCEHTMNEVGLPPGIDCTDNEQKDTERTNAEERTNSFERAKQAKPAHESWASLVAGKSNEAVTSAVPQIHSLIQEDDNQREQTRTRTIEDERKLSKQADVKHKSNRRHPDCTIVIKNVPEGTAETDLRSLFEPFALSTSSEIKRITISSNRGLAFVDYDSVSAVLAVLAQKESFHLHGRDLDVEQKTLERSRGRGTNHNRQSRHDSSQNGSRAGRSGGNNRSRQGGGRARNFRSNR